MNNIRTWLHAMVLIPGETAAMLKSICQLINDRLEFFSVWFSHATEIATSLFSLTSRHLSGGR
jgi:hypothetical protein